VQSQPGGEAIAVFDERIAGIARQFADFRDAEAQGAVRRADSIEKLAVAFDLPVAALRETFERFEAAKDGGEPDPFGRPLEGVPALAPPYLGVRVTAALFHTQGGLTVNRWAQVHRADGEVFENLFAAGGAACGVSGSGDSGYLSGNGLLAAVTLGRVAGIGAGSAPAKASSAGGR